jgi:phosphodiesterase/alkaline phosphatase D-like protein
MKYIVITKVEDKIYHYGPFDSEPEANIFVNSKLPRHQESEIQPLTSPNELPRLG